MSFDIVIHNGIVITVNAEFDIIENGIICIQGDKIKQIEAGVLGSVVPDAKNIIDAKGGIIMPGLINTHTHLPMALFRGLADDLPLMTWLNEHIFPAEGNHISPESVSIGTRLSLAEMLLSGTTTCCDGYFYEEEVAKEVQKSGMRAVLAQGIIDFPAPGVPDPTDGIKTAKAYVSKWNNVSSLITPSIFCHSPYTCSEKTLKEAKAVADEVGVLFQIHVSETKSEFEQMQSERQLSPVGYLDGLGLLNPQTLLVHCVWLEDEDIRTIAERGATISHAPESNMKLAAGIARVPDFLEAKINVGIGTDGCASNNDLDLFSEMDTAAKLHKVNTLDPTVMDAKTVLKMATINGAKAIGLADRIGSIEVGKQADIIVLNSANPHMIPMYNPVSHIVYSAKSSDVQDVIVAGKKLVSDRQLRTIDLKEISEKISLLEERIGNA